MTTTMWINIIHFCLLYTLHHPKSAQRFNHQSQQPRKWKWNRMGVAWERCWWMLPKMALKMELVILPKRAPAGKAAGKTLPYSTEKCLLWPHWILPIKLLVRFHHLLPKQILVQPSQIVWKKCPVDTQRCLPIPSRMVSDISTSLKLLASKVPAPMVIPSIMQNTWNCYSIGSASTQTAREDCKMCSGCC